MHGYCGRKKYYGDEKKGERPKGMGGKKTAKNKWSCLRGILFASNISRRRPLINWRLWDLHLANRGGHFAWVSSSGLDSGAETEFTICDAAS